MLRLWVTHLPAPAVPLLTASILACAANGFDQLVPTGRGASGLRLHYRLIDVAVFDEFIDRPAFKGLFIPSRKIAHCKRVGSNCFPAVGAKATTKFTTGNKYFFFWFNSCMPLSRIVKY
jgi:hypothetical protein